VVVAPHPDDEVLGAGGLMRQLMTRGWAVEVLAVTDGEAAFGAPDPDLARERTREAAEARRRLGTGLAPLTHPPAVRRLGLPDGGVGAHVEQLTAMLGRSVAGARLCVGPWPGDGHPDHEATGVAVERAAGAAAVPLLRYPVWLWHWGDPDRDLPWARCCRLDLAEWDRRAKCRALEAFATQLRPPVGAAPILTPAVLAHFRRDHEIFLA
jgi:LmbE family N-acetylglucosaminyl deacetylase